MAQVVPSPASQITALTTQLRLASAERVATRASARVKAPAPRSFVAENRQEALRARRAFREAVAILQAETVR